jgi:uncharacterized protein (DUF305 family)
MNNNTILLSVLLALIIGGIGGYALKSSSLYSRGGEQSGPGMQHDYKKDQKIGEMGMMDHSKHSMMDMSVSSEREFIEHMIPHHQEAVDTAKEVLARGATTPEIRSLVEGIVNAQEKEIADMKNWYQAWYGEAYTDKGVYTPMMRDLTNLSGAKLDKIFLEDMIMHHMGAIMMAKSVTPHIGHNEMTLLSKAIIDSQTTEIATMRTLLTTIE